MKTRFLALALAAFLLFSLAACKTTSPPPTDDDESSTTEALTTKSAQPEAVLYDGKPIVKYLGGSADEIAELMGEPLGDSGDIPPARIDYDGICFWFDDGILVRAEIHNLALLEIDGAALDRNRAGLINLLGEPEYDGADGGPENTHFMEFQLPSCEMIFEIHDLNEAPVLAHLQASANGPAYSR